MTARSLKPVERAVGLGEQVYIALRAQLIGLGEFVRLVEDSDQTLDQAVLVQRAAQVQQARRQVRRGVPKEVVVAQLCEQVLCLLELSFVELAIDDG